MTINECNGTLGNVCLKNMSRTGHGQPFKFSTLVLLKGIVNLDFGTTMN